METSDTSTLYCAASDCFTLSRSKSSHETSSVICFCTVSTCCFVVEPPTGTRMGSAPPPGHEKPVAGHGLGIALPVGAQNPGSTVRQCEAELSPSELP